jgi:hypothetical protein
MEQTEFYKKNMGALKARDEEFYQTVLDYSQTEEIYFPEKVQAKDGTDITSLKVEGKTWYLNSQYRPLQESVTFAEQYRENPDYSVMVFLGLGNGIVARQIQKSKGEHVNFFFYEPSAELFIHTIMHYDISDLLENKRIHIVVEDLNQDKAMSILQKLIKIENYKLSFYDTLPKYRQLFPTAYEWLKEEYCDAVYRIITYLNTEQTFGRSMVINIIQNMKHFLNCNCRDDFKGVFPVDIPAVVVAAGPSLEKNIQTLKEMKGKAFIVAVDTALQYLVSQGLRPDLATTIDPRKPLHLFEGADVESLYLATDITGNYKAVDLLSGQKIIFSGGDYSYIGEAFKLVDKECNFLQNGGSVATVAFSLLREWGFHRIVLVGQDLALAKDKVHAGNDTVDLHKLECNKIPVEGYDGGVVYTSWDYNEYRKWFERQIAEEDCPEVINATEGGAKIAGAIQMPLREVMDRYCHKTFDFEKAIQEVPVDFTEEDRPKLLDMWNKSLGNLEQLKRRFKEGAHLAERELRLLRQGSYSKGKMKDLHKRIDRLLEECDRYNTEIQLVDSLIALEEGRILDDLFMVEPTSDAEHCRLLEKLKKYMVAMADATEDVREQFKIVIEEMTI